MGINAPKRLEAIIARLEAEKDKIVKILDSSKCSMSDAQKLESRLNELMKKIKQAHQAKSKHTTKNEQLAKLTATAQSIDDIDKAKRFVLNSFKD